MYYPRPLFNIFSVFFLQILQILQQNNVKKCPSSRWRWDSNPQPSVHESASITTRPGLLYVQKYFIFFANTGPPFLIGTKVLTVQSLMLVYVL